MADRQKPIAGNSKVGYLWANGEQNSYYGTRPDPRRPGKFEHRDFRMRRQSAIETWGAWLHDGIEKAKEIEATKERALEMAQNAKTTAKTNDDCSIFILMLIGGAPLYSFSDFDTAAAACDALTHAADACGMAAKYDVVEVKSWPK